MAAGCTSPSFLAFKFRSGAEFSENTGTNYLPLSNTNGGWEWGGISNVKMT